MLKRPIKYKDYEGNEVTETFFFNLSESELIEMEVEYEKGLSGMLEKLIESQNGKDIIAYFKKLVLMSYGLKSEDGKRFIKNDQLREEFVQSAAYNALFMELATDDKAGAIFVKGILPADLAERVDKAAIDSENLTKAMNEAAGAATLPAPVPPVL